MARVHIDVDVIRAKFKVEVIQSKLAARGILSRIGEEVNEWITTNIRQRGQLAGGWEPFSPNTRIKHVAPMIRSGAMLRSFNFRVTGSRVDIGSPMRRAEYQHFGTPPHRIEGNPWLRFPTVRGRVITRAVNHPGNPPRQLIPNRVQAKTIGVRVVEEEIRGAG